MTQEKRVRCLMRDPLRTHEHLKCEFEFSCCPIYCPFNPLWSAAEDLLPFQSSLECSRKMLHYITACERDSTCVFAGGDTDFVLVMLMLTGDATAKERST
jgi:hypothetical protein